MHILPFMLKHICMLRHIFHHLIFFSKDFGKEEDVEQAKHKVMLQTITGLVSWHKIIDDRPRSFLSQFSHETRLSFPLSRHPPHPLSAMN